MRLYNAMTTAEMLLRMALVRTDVSEECITFFIRVTRIGELGITLGVSGCRNTLCNIPENSILHSHRCEQLKSYKTHKVVSVT
jgi:hypothetical protein